jgi:hypothetical protein
VLPSAGKFSFSSQVSACPNFKVKLPVVGTVTIDKPCFGAGVALSTVGVGVCGTVPIPFFTGAVPVTITVGYKWGGDVGIALFDCDLGPYKEANPRASAAGTPYSLTLPGGLPSAMIRVVGRGGPPDVSLTGPGNRTISTANPPSDPSVVVLTDGDTTLIALKHPAGGVWTVTPDSPVVSVASANGLPAPRITANVTGAGQQRVLHYALTPEPGQTVTFAEHGARTYRTIGVARGARGTIRFTPAPGRRGGRQILALVSQSGIQMHSLAVARYAAPKPSGPGRPAHLRVIHRGATLSVTWTRVRGAAGYTVITAASDGERMIKLTKGHALRLSGIPARVRGSLTVQALDTMALRGPAARAAFSPAAGRRR